ncbi:MAG: membrane dipeptidase [Deltaproteobacteria bacterium]|nr:MAG: membrane dipeptidase [Deltaproteobacteria bacterium]
MAGSDVSPEAAELHADALVFDMTLPIITPGRPERKADLFARAARAGFDAQSITLAVDGMDFRAAAAQVAGYRRFVAERSDTCALVDSADAVLEARAAGKLAVLLHFQGTSPFEDELGWVDLFYQLGVRHALMAYNEANRVGCGCHVRDDTGLSAFGRALIREMNRVGMLVDCAHTGQRTTLETIEASRSPVIISHTNARALCDHPRCVRDEVIEACAATGGVLGITGLSAFLGEGGATPGRLVDHIDHVAQLVGAEHVGLGLDYVFDLESFEAFVARMPDRYPPEAGYGEMRQLELEDAPRITEELLRRGYGEREIRGILGENWLRVCRQVWS